jgi:hypothetical protein
VVEHPRVIGAFEGVGYRRMPWRPGYQQGI